ncbi:MAG: hypothetical protein K2N78_05745 [Oscillospiraceae bacterium]|nr:hypothetical protein [Oscillospiraceae bacterium]
MDELMQALFDHITDHLLEKYYGQTAYAERYKARDAIGRRLWEQLPPDQKDLLEQLQQAYDYTQMAELEAMFLASFDQCKSLALSHSA